MKNLTNIQALLLKWIKHYGTRNREQIRIACKRMCISNNIDSQHSLLKLFYPLLKKGFVEFVGNDEYQVSPPLLLFYPKQEIVVGVNFSEEQKLQLSSVDYQEDIWGVIRFNIGVRNIKELSCLINCDYQIYDSSILVHFPRVKDVVNAFDICHINDTTMHFYNTEKHKWNNEFKKSGICKSSNDSFVFYLKHKDKYFKIPDYRINPDGRLLGESFQSCKERDDIFLYCIKEKKLTVKNLNLPILVERILCLSSLHIPNAIEVDKDWQFSFPNITMSMVKQINRIFDTKTKVIDG